MYASSSNADTGYAMIDRATCCLLLAPMLLLLVCLWLADLIDIPDTEPGHTWSTAG